jgi:thioredoxin 1
MATIDLTTEDFEQTVTKDGIVLVDFWAEWCPPCKMFGPVFEASSEENPDLVYAKVDTEAERGLGAALQVNSIPTLMVFRDGILVFRQAGALPASALKQVVDTAKDLDMDEVKKAAKQQAG